MHALDKQHEQPAYCDPHGDPEHDGDGDLPNDVQRKAPAARHRRERGEQHDDEHVVRRSARHDHIGDALVRAVARLLQLEHARHDDGGRHRRHHAPQNGRVDDLHIEQQRAQKYIGTDLYRRGNEAEQDRRNAVLFQVLQIEVEPRPRQDDDKRDLPQVRRDGQNGRRDETEHIRPQHDARYQHPQKRRQPELGADRAEQQRTQTDERQRSQKIHISLLCGTSKKADAPRKTQKSSA